MKKISRAQISTIKEMLYPERKNSQREWNKKILKNLKELEEENKRITEEKKNYISPEPYKIKKFKNIPSRLKFDTAKWIAQKQNKLEIFSRTLNIEQERNFSKPRPFIRNSDTITFNSTMNKPSTSVIETRPFLNDINKNNDENIYNLLNNRKTSMFEQYYSNRQNSKTYQVTNNNNFNNNINNNNNNQDFNNNQESIYNIQNQNKNINDIDSQLKEKDEAIAQLIKDYKEKYGTDEALEKMISEYYGKKDKNEINYIQMNENIYENPNYYSIDSGIILPKIPRNYIRENRKLVIENKIPLKHKQNEEPIIKNIKHKNYGKVPNYIKKYELERKIQKEEKKRQEEASKYPKGTRLLSEEERLGTLDGLIENKKEITNKIEKMPITNRTNSIRMRREELFRKLEEIEKAINMFSKKKVFVKI